MKVTALKKECRANGLKINGQKQDLVMRLEEFERSKVPSIFEQAASAGSDIDDRSSEFRFYLLMKSANLSNYFAFGCLYPLALEESEIYKNENREQDIFSQFPDYIVLTKVPRVELETTDVLVELILNGYNVAAIADTDYVYVDSPVAISRVKTLFFRSETALLKFKASIATYPDCFVPSSICKVHDGISLASKSTTEIANVRLPRNETLAKWKNQLELFDRILGVFGFMKNSGVFKAESENMLEEYSTGFFGTLNIINRTPKLHQYKENVLLRTVFSYRSLEINNSQRSIFKAVIDRIYEGLTFDLPTAIRILELSSHNASLKPAELESNGEIIKLFGQLERLEIPFRTVVRSEALQRNLPALALLFLSKFSNKSRQHSDKQAVRNVFIEDTTLHISTLEYILGMMGLYYGYKNMVRDDTNLNVKDKYFADAAIQIQSIKFRMGSFLERFIVESAFQYASKGVQLNEAFDYLNWGPIEFSDLKPKIFESNRYTYVENPFELLQHRVRVIRRIDKAEAVYSKLRQGYPEKIQSSSYLFQFLVKHLPFDREQIINELQKSGSSLPLDELERVVDLDNRSKKMK